jgi:hypothetical protein
LGKEEMSAQINLTKLKVKELRAKLQELHLDTKVSNFGKISKKGSEG